MPDKRMPNISSGRIPSTSWLSGMFRGAIRASLPWDHGGVKDQGADGVSDRDVRSFLISGYRAVANSSMVVPMVTRVTPTRNSPIPNRDIPSVVELTAMSVPTTRMDAPINRKLETFNEVFLLQKGCVERFLYRVLWSTTVQRSDEQNEIDCEGMAPQTIERHIQGTIAGRLDSNKRIYLSVTPNMSFTT